jgi:transcriptional regulator with PAS, ATPase and Fis domain
MKDQDETKKRPITRQETSQDKADEFKERDLRRDTFIHLLSMVDEDLRLRGAALWWGLWTWDITSDELIFRLRPMHDEGSEQEERQIRGSLEEMVSPPDLQKVMTWLRFVIGSDQESESIYFTTRHGSNLKFFGPVVKRPDGLTQVAVAGSCIEFTPSTKTFPESDHFNRQERLERGFRYHFDDIMEKIELMTKTLGPISNIKSDLPAAAQEMHSELLRHHERALEIACTVVTELNGALFFKNPRGRFVFVNSGMTTLLRLSKSQILGKTDRELAQISEWQIEDVPSTETSRDACYLIRKGSKSAVNRLMLVTLPLLMYAERAYIGFLLPREEPTHGLETKYISKRMQECERKARKVAESDRIILLTGESGSGKDYLARYIHEHSPRAEGPYFSINCAAIPTDLAESELFGHEKGAFTSATSRKLGLLELAVGGTLVLNEIGELSPLIQAKLLQFLETKKFTRIGGEKEISVNARLIAATNRNLEQEVQQGKFRSDLYYRINAIQIKVPPLRERPEDLRPLVDELLDNIRKEERLPYTPFVDDAALQAMAREELKGNVRELKNILLSAIIEQGGPHVKIGSSADDKLDADPSRTTGLAENRETGAWTWTIPFPLERKLEDLVKDLKRALVEEALRRAKGKKKEAARLLGIDRHTLAEIAKKS